MKKEIKFWKMIFIAAFISVCFIVFSENGSAISCEGSGGLCNYYTSGTSGGGYCANGYIDEGVCAAKQGRIVVCCRKEKLKATTSVISACRDSALDYARNMVGGTYTQNLSKRLNQGKGTGKSSTFDCSGFTSAVYNTAGIAIPKTDVKTPPSQLQAFTALSRGFQVGNFGKDASLSKDIDKLKPGDLLFFVANPARKSVGNTSHVAIFSRIEYGEKNEKIDDGKGEVEDGKIVWIVHARNSKKGILEEPIPDWHKLRYVGAMSFEKALVASGDVGKCAGTAVS